MQVPYLIEWLEFHRILGFNHFVVYDDFSSDNVSLLETLYREHGRQYITVHAPTGHGTNNERRSQNAGHCSRHYSNASDWMINIDVDEFITLSPYTTIQEYLTAEVAEGTHMIYVGATRFGWAGQRQRFEYALQQVRTTFLPFKPCWYGHTATWATWSGNMHPISQRGAADQTCCWLSDRTGKNTKQAPALEIAAQREAGNECQFTSDRILPVLQP